MATRRFLITKTVVEALVRNDVPREQELEMLKSLHDAAKDSTSPAPIAFPDGTELMVVVNTLNNTTTFTTFAEALSASGNLARLPWMPPVDPDAD